MPVRRLNYTARQRIAREDADIVLRGEGTEARFDAHLQLAGYHFPPDARVFVEAYRQTMLMRFDFGTVSAPAPPEERALTEFPSADEVLFRVKVTATSVRPGVLLGEADQLRPREPEQKPERRVPLLPVVPDDLGDEIWRVDFGDRTSLVVSKNLHDWKQTAASHLFRALVFPAAMRQILERILLVERYTETDDPHSWQSQWLQFAAQIPGSGALPVRGTSDDFDEWIENAVGAFARLYRMREQFTAELAQQ
jgi:hypothetical protein